MQAPIQWFFAGLPATDAGVVPTVTAHQNRTDAFLLAPGGDLIAENFPRIRASRVQREIANLVHD